MKSLHDRLDYQMKEVLRFTEIFGRTRAMAEFKVRDYVAFYKWLEEVTGDENFGLNFKLGYNGHQTLGDQLVDAFLRKVANLEAQNKTLSDRIDFLEWTLARTKNKEDMQALAIVEACQA